ncbi:rod shape-determining protein RodA [Candidatus Berkelbacteria bacterium RIFOXYA2_FULL_43_10]|uniref:Peptidoglycan glycosyltransferase RodA n=1 Tax=Candidatus Berkelbacteria bacterium RIFOXYA2_FULL_43_10 TaxID=1797472 RepID=A0A1F5E7E2_9BACT|nr:MAG: rod shape-determining protein RodA [Candidatus Berkelbacteria bacterium RIFOXYA2_FULL_43_10]
MGNKIKIFDFTLFIVPLIITALSIALIYSLVFSGDDVNLALRQGIFAAGSIAIAVAISFSDYRALRGLWWVFYLLSLLLLLYVDLFGHVSGGAMRWIDLGFFQLQPSEIAKVGVYIMLSSFLCGKIGAMRIKDYIVSIILTAIPFILILKEPDLGTALVVIFIYIVMILASKPNLKQTIAISATILILAGTFLLSVFNVGVFGRILKDYQRSRVFTFIDPGRDPYDQGYNVRQAQIAVGSGGIFGKGLGRGSQSQLEFLPKPHTDFIFAGAGEALGFFGSSFLILLYLYLIYRVLTISTLAKDTFGSLLAIGVAAMLFFQTVVNIGMNLGLMPVTGIPLPLLSYGGSSLLVTYFSLGVVQSIFIRHRKINF